MSFLGPRGWSPATISHRFSDSSPVPSSYDATNHTVHCVISMGSPVKRFYGTEILRIDDKSVDLSRMHNGSIIPLLDSHQSTGINNALGRFKETWIRRGALMGKIIFNQTPSGQMAEGMVARGEIAGISAGYAVHAWEIKNSEGRVIDPDNDQVRWDEDLSFEAINWELHDGSLVSVPADSLSGIRSFGSGADRATPEFDQLTDIRARMIVRQRMAERQSASYGNFDD